MKKYLWFVLALTLSACSSSSTDSAGGIDLAGNWRGVMSTSGGRAISQRFRMTLRYEIIEGEDDDVTFIFDGTVAFTEPHLECLTGGAIIPQGTQAGSRVAFQMTERASPPRFITDFTGNASNSRIEGTWAMVAGSIEIIDPDNPEETIEVAGPCDAIGGQWVANRI